MKPMGGVLGVGTFLKQGVKDKMVIKKSYHFTNLPKIDVQDCCISSGGVQYVTLLKYLSHPSLVIYPFATPTHKNWDSK